VVCCVSVELALKPSLNAKLIPAHARHMDMSSNSAADTAGLAQASDASAAAAGGGGASGSVG